MELIKFTLNINKQLEERSRRERMKEYKIIQVLVRFSEIFEEALTCEMITFIFKIRKLVEGVQHIPYC